MLIRAQEEMTIIDFKTSKLLGVASQIAYCNKKWSIPYNMRCIVAFNGTTSTREKTPVAKPINSKEVWFAAFCPEECTFDFSSPHVNSFHLLLMLRWNFELRFGRCTPWQRLKIDNRASKLSFLNVPELYRRPDHRLQWRERHSPRWIPWPEGRN